GNTFVTTFTRRLDVVPGDVSDDGLVNVTDVTTARSRIGSTNIFADVNGDGVVNVTDVTTDRSRIGSTLPPQLAEGGEGPGGPGVAAIENDLMPAILDE